MKFRAVRCLFVMVCVTTAVAGCGSRSSSPSTTSKVKIDCGPASCLALKSDGSLWAWGYGPLGLGKSMMKFEPSQARLRPTQVGVASDWAAVASSWSHCLALKSDGSLWAWGDNVAGQLGLGDTRERRSPTRVGAASDWAAVACAEDFSLALKEDGSLWAWGSNLLGHLGLGNTPTLVDIPTRVGTASDWAAIACEEDSSLALKKDGSLWTWGDNAAGELGLGNNVAVAESPTRVGAASDWAAIAGGGTDFSLALKKDGSLWAWGDNYHCQLGLGDTRQRSSPTRVGTASDWAVVACGEDFSLALKKDGSLWAWGDNSVGELGLGNTPILVDSPTRVGTANDWAAVAGGFNHSLALKKDGSLWTWGWNKDGQLGLGDTRGRNVPTRIPGWSP